MYQAGISYSNKQPLNLNCISQQTFSLIHSTHCASLFDKLLYLNMLLYVYWGYWGRGNVQTEALTSPSLCLCPKWYMSILLIALWLEPVTWPQFKVEGELVDKNGLFTENYCISYRYPLHRDKANRFLGSTQISGTHAGSDNEHLNSNYMDWRSEDPLECFPLDQLLRTFAESITGKET